MPSHKILADRPLFFRMIAFLLLLPVILAWGQPDFSFSNFYLFQYPGAQLDSLATQLLLHKLREQYPQARSIKGQSWITRDVPLSVLSHYAIMTGRRYHRRNDRFVFPFKNRRGAATDRIEIFSQPQPRLSAEFWCTRINLILLDFPLMTGHIPLQRSAEELKVLAGRLLYEGSLREDLAALRQDELGGDAKVLVIDTSESFDTVYQFFRRRHGRIRIIPARHGEIMTRDCEFNATRTLGLQERKLELHIRAEENPVLTDREGNSQMLPGHVLIQYTFWPVIEPEPEP